MKGHSRGEWYGTLDDIIESVDLADYWAVFSVTHRGNKHCLGEFPSESAAWAAARGSQFFPPIPPRPSLSTSPPRLVIGQSRSTSGSSALIHQSQSSPSPRVVVQFEVFESEGDKSMIELFALCNDGTVWHCGIGVGNNRGFMDESWTEVTLNWLDK